MRTTWSNTGSTTRDNAEGMAWSDARSATGCTTWDDTGSTTWDSSRGAA